MTKRLSKRKTMRRKTMRRKTMRRKTMRRKTMRRKTAKGGFIGMQCGSEWRKQENKVYYNKIKDAKNKGLGTRSVYDIDMILGSQIVKIKDIKLKDIYKIREAIKEQGKKESEDVFKSVVEYNFDEFFRGDEGNCKTRFRQINEFFTLLETYLNDNDWWNNNNYNNFFETLDSLKIEYDIVYDYETQLMRVPESDL